MFHQLLLKLEGDVKGFTASVRDLDRIGSAVVVDAVLVAVLRRIVLTASLADEHDSVGAGVNSQVCGALCWFGLVVHTTPCCAVCVRFLPA